METFDELKEICRRACHERNACKEGFEALMQAESIGGILAVWRKNWHDVYKSKYADVMADNIVGVYARMGDEFRRSEVYVNESSERGLVIICRPTARICLGGTAKGYIFGTDAEVEATDNAQVYCRTAGVMISLLGHAYCSCENREAVVAVRNFAQAHGEMQCHTWNAAQVVITNGTLCDHGHRRISAYGGARIYSDATKGIELGGQARQYPLAEYPADNNDNENDNTL